MKESVKEWGAGGVSGFIGLAFGLASALTFGWEQEITSFLTDLSTSTIAFGPFDLSQASIASILLVLGAGGVNFTSSGANSDSNHYATLGLAGLFLLMGLPSFQNWVASNTGVSFLAFMLSIAGYSVIGGLGVGSDDSSSFLSGGISKLSGGRL